ncbi:unnamed protein product, partial [Iphiclides podalirius]
MHSTLQSSAGDVTVPITASIGRGIAGASVSRALARRQPQSALGRRATRMHGDGRRIPFPWQRLRRM